MRCLLPMIALLGAAHAAPFFKIRFGPQHRSDAEAGPELPAEPFPGEVPGESSAMFALQLPKIDLSDIFKPLKVFAGVNVDHPPAIAVREGEPNCDLGKFELTDEEFDIVMDCQKLVGGDEVELKECILTKLPKTTVELRDFLDREEFGVAGLSSSFHLALLDGEFTQKKSVQFRLCPRDEVNSIDGEEVVPVVQEMVPVVEEMVPIEVLNPDRIDGMEPEMAVTAPGAETPPHRPLFQFPELKLPNFGQIFTQAFAPVFGPQPGGEEDAGLGLFGSHLNPFAVRQPPAVQAGPQQGFFQSLFPALAATPPPQGHPDGIDMSDCTSQKFDVSRFVFNVANRCQYANDYRKCLQLDLAGDESAKDLLEFAVDPSYSVVASSFSSFQTTFDLEALHSGKGLTNLARKNQIDLRRCANIVKEEVVPETTEATIEEVASASELAPGPEATEGPFAVPESAPEVTEVVAEVIPEGILEVVPEVVPEAASEEIPIVLVEQPAEPGSDAGVALPMSPVEPEVITEIFDVTPEIPVEQAVGAEKEAVEAKKAYAGAEKAAVAKKTPVEAEKSPVDAEKAPVEAEKAPVKAEKAPVEAEKAAVEVEKAAVKVEKAAAGVENPAEEAKPVESKDNAQTSSAYDVAEP